MPDYDETRDASSPTRSAAGEPPTASAADPDRTRSGGTGETFVSVTPPPPPVVPGYEILEEIGSGGMGDVYRARETAFDRDVAVKVLQPRYPANGPAARRFLDEARITAQLQHPGIPPVHHIGTLPDGRPFLAMKLIKGDTLADLLATEPANRGRFVAAFAQVCQAVGYAHSRNVIHRDLKPANVMVGAFGEVQVMDWGLAKVLGERPRVSGPSETEPQDDETTEIRSLRGDDLATQAGSVLGTPAFMAPEQAQGAIDEVDERADVFGLGAVLCAILTGKPPYAGGSTDAVRLRAIRGETTDALARLDGCGADPELAALCKRCLAVRREDRPRDAGEVARAVADHLAATEERARQAELDRVRAEEQRKRRRTQFALAGSVLLLLAVAAIGASIASLWQTAEQAKEAAESLRGEAETARDAAEKAREGEAGARQQVEAEREKLAVFEYGRAMQIAHQEWRDNNFVAMRALLDGTKPELRGWEWRYLKRLYEGSLLTLKGHTRLVSSACFSPDGSRVVTGSGDNTAKVWDARTGAEVLTLRGHTRLVSSACFSPDGSRVVTGSGDDTAKVWDAGTGAELLTLKGHTSTVLSACFSPDGSQVVTGSWDETAKVWDAGTGAELLTLKGHTRSVFSAGFSPDGSRVVTGSWDETAKVWDAGTGAELLTLKGHTDSVSSACFSPDGSRVVTGSQDETVRVWDARTGAEVLTLKGHTGGVSSACFSPDGSRVVTGDGAETARVWDARPFRDSRPPDPEVAPPPRPAGK